VCCIHFLEFVDDPHSIPVKLKADVGLAPAKYSVTIETSSAVVAALNLTFTVDVVPELVVMQDLAFHPQNITVPVGTPVTWVNLDSPSGVATQATTTSRSSPARTPTSPVMTMLDTWSYTFDAAGVVEYYCTIHAFMKGQATVTG